MAKACNPGALRTLVSFYRPVREADADGYRTGAETIVCKNVRVKWVNKHGADILAMRQLGLQEGATLTMRFRTDITPDCIIRKYNDPERPYEVIGVNNIEDRCVWMEVTVARKVIST